ncbi:hypothetical protein [Sulfolobus spindle-shaped virus]|nr:hypothetical protein [Sulfolobus spindle-shaped virus]
MRKYLGGTKFNLLIALVICPSVIFIFRRGVMWNR